MNVPFKWDSWGADGNLDNALLIAFGAMKETIGSLGDELIDCFYLGWFMWTYGRFVGCVDTNKIAHLQKLLGNCQLSDSLQEKVLEFFKENNQKDWESSSDEEWAVRSIRLLRLIDEIQQQLG